MSEESASVDDVGKVIRNDFVVYDEDPMNKTAHPESAAKHSSPKPSVRQNETAKRPARPPLVNIGRVVYKDRVIRHSPVAYEKVFRVKRDK